MSSPLLDRIDLHIVADKELRGKDTAYHRANFLLLDRQSASAKLCAD